MGEWSDRQPHPHAELLTAEKDVLELAELAGLDREHHLVDDLAPEELGQRLDLRRDIDVVLMRQDPPFHLGYISAALLLDRLRGTTLVSNDPREVINAPEKMYVLDYARFMPPTLVARNLADEYGPKGVRVNCIAPGLIKTDFAKALWDNPETLNVRHRPHR